MPILIRYLTREIVKSAVIILAFVVTIYIAVEFFEKIDDFLEKGLPLMSVLIFLLYEIPFIVAQIFPLTLLLSVLVTFGIMSRHNELIALKSCGISIQRLLKPVLGIGLVCACLLFCLSEIFVPLTKAKSNRIWLEEVKKVSAVATQGNSLWIKGANTIYIIGKWLPDEKTIQNFSIHFFNNDLELIRRIDAEKGVYSASGWTLKNLLIQEIDPTTGIPQVAFHAQQEVALDLLPKDISRLNKTADEMSFTALRTLIQKEAAEGMTSVRHRVDLNKKIAFPFVCIIMCLVGTGIAVRGKLREGLPVIVVYGLGVAFLYWIILGFCLSLGYGGILPPVMAAWAANLIFLLVGTAIFINSEY